MFSKATIPTCGLLVAAMLTVTSSANADFDDLLRRVPSSANTLVLIDVDALTKTPLGKKNRVREKYAAEYGTNPLMFPPETDRLVLAAKLDAAREMHADWQLAVMELNENLSMSAIARAERGYQDNINGLRAVWTPANTYFVEVEPRVLGLLYPANRQHVYRWATYETTNKSIEVSPYLEEAARNIGLNGQIVFAIDLAGVPQPHELRDRLEEMECLADKKCDRDQLAGALLGLRGITFNIEVGEKRYGKLRVDFDRNISMFAEHMKPLLLEALDEKGLMIDEFNDWKVEVSDKAVLLEGYLDVSGIRRVFSLLDMPKSDLTPDSPEQAANVSKEAQMAEQLSASKHYYDSLQTYFRDLGKSLIENRHNPSVWMRKYGQKVDRLPILNVDADLVSFGTNMGERFRQMSQVRRKSMIQSGVRKSKTWGSTYNYSGYRVSGTGVYRNSGYDRQMANLTIRKEAKAKSMNNRIDQMTGIENDLAQVRIDMTNRYGVQF